MCDFLLNNKSSFLNFHVSQFCEIPAYMKEHPRDCAEAAYTVTRISASDCTSAAVWPREGSYTTY